VCLRIASAEAQRSLLGRSAADHRVDYRNAGQLTAPAAGLTEPEPSDTLKTAAAIGVAMLSASFARGKFRHPLRSGGAGQPLLQAVEVKINHRGCIEGQQLAHRQPADDGKSERLA
jgi:hypothetical protein